MCIRTDGVEFCSYTIGLEGEFKANNLVKHFSDLGIGCIHRPTLNRSHHKIAYLLELPSYAEPGENENICS